MDSGTIRIIGIITGTAVSILVVALAIMPTLETMKPVITTTIEMIGGLR